MTMSKDSRREGMTMTISAVQTYGRTITLVPLPATPEEFLAAEPQAILDMHDACGGPECYPRPEVLLPNLVALVRRLGGPDAVPTSGRERERVGWDFEDNDRDNWPSATLRDRGMGDVVARLTRCGCEINVHDWHEEDGGLTVILIPPADWSAAPWAIRSVYGMDRDHYHAHTAACDILAARALDRRLAECGDPAETFLQILSEAIRP
jgi:hypothetical protein